MTKKQLIVLGLIMAIAIFFRFYLINQVPDGLHPDEAANGIDINSMQQGQLQPFYERGNGREALFFYMEWASVELFGKGAWQHHITSATVGVIAVLLCFLVAQKLFTLFLDWDKKRATNLALLAAFLMAVSTWHVSLSRTAFRANLIAIFGAATIYALLLTYTASTKAKRILYGALTGAIFALGFYTYIAYRILVPILIVAIVWPWLVDLFRKPHLAETRKLLIPGITFIIAFVIFIFPIAKYFYTHEGSFVGRSSQVSVFNPELNHGDLNGTIAETTKLSLLGFFTQGDLNWRHNVSGEPFLPWIVSPFFAIGLIVSLLLAIRYFFEPRRHAADWKHFLMTGWFWGMLLPVVTTAEGIPHGLRSIGLIPVVFILTAYGFFLVSAKIQLIRNLYIKWLPPHKQRLLKIGSTALVTSFALALICHTYILCISTAYASPEAYYAFRSDLSPVSNYLNGFDSESVAIPAGKIPEGYPNRHTKANTYLVLDSYSIQTVDYLTSVDGAHPGNPKNQPYHQVDPEHSWQLTGLKSGDEIVFTESSIFDIKKFKQYHPQARLVREYRNRFGQAIMAVYVMP